ncbi:unnamed protein product [Aphanomyces euteiches]|uniref:6-phosphogluconolactonase n=1 Tax=Aphanomyces euteiches TaxID=100861 RepID=A0A6G0WVK6_9STRA|nr:hypothetical protein Ae201684_011143 [Aphanomyces euteiches]KAH9058664.1 hypothetical protein Ae201684P_006005 [Aphanomyces euteiches]KAH9154578.1 hypothetical protein AeRB84_003352 [Aphanomyces euteiches]
MTSSTLVVGTYTRKEGHVDGKGKGICTIKVSHETGELSLVHVNEDVGVNPSFVIARSATGHVIAVNEDAYVTESHPQGTGYVTSFSIDDAGVLTFQSKQPSHGSYTCHANFDPSGRFVVASNYGGGNIALYPISPEGVLSPATSVVQMTGASLANPQRQEAPHCHSSTWITPTILAVMDLGNDKVMQFTLNTATGVLEPHARPHIVLPPGSGPRHMGVHPTKPLAYVVNELSNTLSVHSIDATDGLSEPLQIASILPPESAVDGTTLAAEVHVSKCGNFVLCSTRGPNCIAVLRITYPAGHVASPTFVSSNGSFPRHFQLVGDDLVLVANQNSDSIFSFRLTPAEGLKPTGHQLNIPTPVCLSLV